MLFKTLLMVHFISGPCVADPEPVYGKKGSSIIFICPYKSTSSYSLSWYFVNNTVYPFPISDESTILPLSSPHPRAFIVGDHTAGVYNLNMSGLQESDEGVYRCTVGSNQQKEYKLELLAAPSLLILQDVTTENKILGTEGQSLSLRCAATGGKPPPLVTITVDNVATLAIQYVQYIITNLQRENDQNLVQCNANSSALNSPLVTTAALYLNLKPLQPIFSVDPVSTEENKPLMVICTSSGSRPAATFQWTLGLANLTSYATIIQSTLNNSDDTYTVTSALTYSVDRTNNGQTITCTTINIAATNGVQISKKLDVKFAPDITVNNVTYNQNTATKTVTCIPVGNPTTYTYYTWRHKSTYGLLIRELVGGQNGVLNLPNVSVEKGYQDSGEYVCIAANGITGKDGKIQQSGFGYASVNAQPVFTNDSKETEYGEFGSDVTMHVYVYSVPKYTSLTWYTSNMQILQTDKYTVSESRAIVKDKFHGTVVQLDGYRVTLTVNNLVESDFNVSYRVELSNGVGSSVIHTTTLLSASAPQTPMNFTVRSTVSSIVVQWEAGYNGGQEQTFYLQFRRFGSSAWVAIKIPDTIKSGIQTYTLSELQDGILFELMMYAENTFKKSLPTETKTIETIKASRLSSSEDVIKGVAGGLSAVIFIMCIIIVIFVKLWKNGINGQKSKPQYSRRKEGTAYSVPMDVKETDENTDTVDKRGKQTKTITGSAQEYETLGMKDNPNTYSEILTKQVQKQSKESAQEYETVGMVGNPNTYSALNSQSAQQSSEYTNIKI